MQKFFEPTVFDWFCSPYLFIFQDVFRVLKKWTASFFDISFLLGGFGRIGLNEICMTALRFKTCLFKKNVRKWGRAIIQGHILRRLRKMKALIQRFIAEKIMEMHKEIMRTKSCPFSTQSRNTIGCYSGFLGKDYVTRRILHTNAAKCSPFAKSQYNLSLVLWHEIIFFLIIMQYSLYMSS